MRSSTVINPAAYSGGTFVVRPPNYTAYYMRAMMHQQAKQQALSQYYDKLQNSINPAGVRDIDLDGWNQKADAWQKFGIENRDALVNPRLDGGKAMARFQSMHRDLLGDAQKSKQAAQKEMSLQKIYSNPNEAARATDSDMRLAHSISSSIYDPQHYQDDGVTPHNLTEFSFNAPPYDYKMQKAVASQVTAGLKPSKTFGKATQRDYAAGTEVVPFTSKHSTENLKEMANRMGDLYDKNPSMQRSYESEKLDPDKLTSLSQAYKSVFPNDDIVGPDGTPSPKKIAQAEVIRDNSAVNSSSELHSVPRIPVGRGLTQAQQNQQLMLNLTNQMGSAMKAGNLDEVNRLAGTWYSGNGKSQFQGIEKGPITDPWNTGVPNATPKQGYLIRHVDKQWVPDDPKNPAVGSYKDVLNTTEIDPNDPNLISKLANQHQAYMGSTPALEQGVAHQILNAPPAATPTTTPTAVPKAPPVDPDALLKKYAPTPQ